MSDQVGSRTKPFSRLLLALFTPLLVLLLGHSLLVQPVSSQEQPPTAATPVAIVGPGAVPVLDVAILGRATVPPGQAANFSAVASPLSATLPITYRWQATGQTPVQHVGGRGDLVSFTWTSTGPKTVTATVNNAGGTAVATHTVNVVVGAPGFVLVTGPLASRPGTAVTFTATVSPPDTTTPLLYTWSATDQTPVPHVGGLSDSATFTWVTTGTKTITVTASNASGTAIGAYAHVVSVAPIPVLAVALDGPSHGLTQLSHTFSATVAPLAATAPITYLWQATGQPPVEQVDGPVSIIDFSWETPGTKEVSVTAYNLGGSAVATQTVQLTAASHWLQLPIIRKQ